MGGDFGHNGEDNFDEGDEDKEYVATMKEKFLSNQVKPGKFRCSLVFSQVDAEAQRQVPDAVGSGSHDFGYLELHLHPLRCGLRTGHFHCL